MPLTNSDPPPISHKYRLPPSQAAPTTISHTPPSASISTSTNAHPSQHRNVHLPHRSNPFPSIHPRHPPKPAQKHARKRRQPPTKIHAPARRPARLRAPAAARRHGAWIPEPTRTGRVFFQHEPRGSGSAETEARPGDGGEARAFTEGAELTFPGRLDEGVGS